MGQSLWFGQNSFFASCMSFLTNLCMRAHSNLLKNDCKLNLHKTGKKKITIQEVWCKLSFASCLSHLDFGPYAIFHMIILLFTIA